MLWPLLPRYSLTRAKLGLFTGSLTPSWAQRALMKVVLPTPIAPRKAATGVLRSCSARAAAAGPRSWGPAAVNSILLFSFAVKLSPGFQNCKRNEHLFHGNAAVLEAVLVIAYIVVVIVGVGKEVVARSKNVGGRHIGLWQKDAFGLAYLVNRAGVVGQVFSLLVAQVGIGVAVAHHLYGILYPYGAVVGGYHHLYLVVGQASEQFKQGRMLEPGKGEGAVGGLVGDEFPNHFHFGACVREHVYEVDYNDRQIVVFELMVMVEHFPARFGVADFLIVYPGVALPDALEVVLEQCFFVLVLAAFVVLFYP